MEENFKSASNHHIYKLWDYTQKFSVWIQKQQRYTIIRLLYKVLLKEMSTNWTEEKLIIYKDKEEFALY